MKYALRYTLNDTNNKFKARLLPPSEQTPEGVQVQTLEFDAANDETACAHVTQQIAVPEGNDRPIANLKRVVALSRPKIERGGGKKATRPLIDLNGIQEPLASKLFDAITPMIDAGDLTENDLKIYINTTAPNAGPVAEPQVVNQKPEGMPEGVQVAVCPMPKLDVPSAKQYVNELDVTPAIVLPTDSQANQECTEMLAQPA